MYRCHFAEPTPAVTSLSLSVQTPQQQQPHSPKAPPRSGPGPGPSSHNRARSWRCPAEGAGLRRPPECRDREPPSPGPGPAALLGPAHPHVALGSLLVLAPHGSGSTGTGARPEPPRPLRHVRGGAAQRGREPASATSFKEIG